MMDNGLTIHQANLPELATTLHPVVAKGLKEDRLMLVHDFSSAEQAIADYRMRHSPEKMSYFRFYFLKPHPKDNDRAILRYVINRSNGSGQNIAIIPNDIDAARIAIGNNLSDYYMAGIRWELYEDPDGEELIEMGRLDQWDLLKGITGDKLALLAKQGVRPVGNWDFQGFLWPRVCSVCGESVVINGYAFNIDSGVCSKCGNRPWLAPSLHRYLDCMEELRGKESYFLMPMHALVWMEHVAARFGEVCRDPDDKNGRRVMQLCWNNTLIAGALDESRAERVRAMIETNTEIDFAMYQGCAQAAQKALIGEKPFSEEARIALNYVVSATKLIHQKQLATS